jgi:hypothetical protein
MDLGTCSGAREGGRVSFLPPWQQPTPAPRRVRAEDVAARIEKHAGRIRRGNVLAVIEPGGRYRIESVRDAIAAAMTAAEGSILVVRGDRIHAEARGIASRRGLELVELDAA